MSSTHLSQSNLFPSYNLLVSALPNELNMMGRQEIIIDFKIPNSHVLWFGRAFS